MKTIEQRISMMHDLAFKKRRKAEEAVLKALGTVSLGLLAFLIGWIYLIEGELHPVADVGFTGNSMLSADVGGYVLVAVLAFVAAVVLTVICIKLKDKNKGTPDE